MVDRGSLRSSPVSAWRRPARKRLTRFTKYSEVRTQPKRKTRAQEEKRAAEADTLEAVAAEFFKREGPKLRTARKWESDLRRLVLPTFGKRPIASLRRKEITRLLDRIEDNNGLAQADTTLAIVRRIANWHAVRMMISRHRSCGA